MRSICNDNLLSVLTNNIRKLNIGQIVILIASILLAVWCIYNVRIICFKYYDYDTIISLSNDPPNITAFPGITVCAPSIFKPQKLAELYPKFNESLNEFIIWRRKKEEELDFWVDMNQTARQIRYNELKMYESMAMADFSASFIIKNLSVRPEQLLLDCHYHLVNIRSFQISHKENQHVAINSRRCNEIKSVLESIYEGKKCFTYFSALVDKRTVNSAKSTASEVNKTQMSPKMWSEEFKNLLVDTDEQMVFDLNPSIEMRVKALDDDVWISYVLDSVLMTVHPPNVLQNRRNFLFFPLSRSEAYEVAFTKKTTILLERPFKTRCVNYPIVEQNIKQKAKTRDHCISLCIASHHRENEMDCANYYSVLTERMFTDDMENMTICDHSHQDYDRFLQMRATCEEACPNACNTNIFEISGQMRDTVDFESLLNCPVWYKSGSFDGKEIDFDEELSSEMQLLDYYEFTNNTSPSRVLMRQFTPWRKWRHYIAPSSTAAEVHSTQSYYSSVKSRNSKSKYKTECNAKVSIRIAPKPWTVVQHHQAFSYEGFLGTVGGHIGIWLGLSLYKIIKFGVHLLYNLLHKAMHKFFPDFLTHTTSASG